MSIHPAAHIELSRESRAHESVLKSSECEKLTIIKKNYLVDPTPTLSVYVYNIYNYVCHGPARYLFLILTISTDFTAHALKLHVL